jgi:nucleoside-diphosphate-sugar epimerase
MLAWGFLWIKVVKSDTPALVTGSSGFMGRHLVRALLDQHRNVTAVTRRPDSFAGIQDDNLSLSRGPWDDDRWLREHLSPGDSIFHLASARAQIGIRHSMFQAINVDATLRLARTAIDIGCGRFVYLSTALIFGCGEPKPTEITGLDQIPAWRNDYLRSKADAARMMHELQDEGLNLITLYPVIVYGPDNPHHPNRVTNQIRSLLKQRIDFVIGRGGALRELAYIDDVIAAIIAAERAPNTERPLVLGGESISHRDFNRKVFELAHVQPFIEFSIPQRAASAILPVVDIEHKLRKEYSLSDALTMLTSSWIFQSSAARETLGYEPRPLSAGLRETIAWLT